MGGEFYLENLPIGLVPMQIDWRGRVGVCTISIPASEATQVDLGTVTCELR